MENQFTIIAHRGATTDTIKENTVQAFQRAIDLNADMIETDVRKMKDGTLVCAHDPHWRGRKLKDMTFKEWSKWTMSEEGWQPALLSDVLEVCNQKIPLNLEIKEKNIEKEIIRTLPASFPHEHLLFSSFEDEVITIIKRENSRYKTSLIVGKSLLKTRKKWSYWQDFYPEKRLRETGADAICPYFRLVDKSYINRLLRHGYSMYAWTVNKEEQIHKMKRLGVRGIFTDNVSLAQLSIKSGF